jgi:hypothetical protein
MNYKKWNNIEEIDDDDITTPKYLQLKHNADEIFANCHTKNDYKTCLDMYKAVLNRLHIEISNPTSNEIYTPCLLNICCCYVKLTEWEQCLLTLSEIDSSHADMTTTQRIKYYHFKAYSLMKVDGEINLHNADRILCDLEELLASIKSPHGKSNVKDVSLASDVFDMAQYEELHDKIRRKLSDEIGNRISVYEETNKKLLGWKQTHLTTDTTTTATTSNDDNNKKDALESIRLLEAISMKYSAYRYEFKMLHVDILESMVAYLLPRSQYKEVFIKIVM